MRATTRPVPRGAARHEQPPPAVPGRLGDWLLLRELGRGAMAVVYEALWRDGGAVALKLPLCARGGRALRREARALTAAGPHPELVGLVARATPAGRDALALDLVRGTPLDVVLRGGPLPPREAALALAGPACALAHLHARGVVHRDVKPANVIVRPGGRGVLMDRGLARSPGEVDDSGWAVGSPAYMPTDQLCGVRAGPAADVFALGVSLYEALTGCLPHSAPTTSGIVSARSSRPALAPRELAPHVPAELDDLVVACLADRAFARPRAIEVAARLEAWARPTLLARLTALAARGRSVSKARSP